MKIIIFGATGSGKTTLGKSISEKLSWTFLDSDDYYWEKTNPPFQTKIPLEKRNKNLKTDFNNNKNVVTTGSLCTWSKYWDSAFDLGVFLRLPKTIRMNRLKNRELERYGEGLKTNLALKEKSKAFLQWAEKYDDEKTEGHSINQHRNWIKVLDCPVIELNDDLTNLERLMAIIKKMEDYKS